MKKVVLIGDSIRMGYQPFVVGELKDLVEVWGPAENGGPSRRIVEHLDDWVVRSGADVIHLNCGLHDLRREFGADTACPLADYRRNVETILRAALERSRAAVIWATTTPVNQAWHHARKGFDRFEADVDAFNCAALAVAQSLGVEVNDLNALVAREGRDTLLTPDGVHFTPDGYRKLGAAVAEAIRRRLG
jgi:lysophospholipase L1-like esterase